MKGKRRGGREKKKVERTHPRLGIEFSETKQKVS